MALSSGGRNLLFLGLGSVAIAGITTAISVAIYHYSGDIYLDRSRPGFLPDEDEESEDQRQTIKYTFSDSGPIDATSLDEYLTQLRPTLESLKQLSDPFPQDPLSNETLAIPD